MRRSARCGGEGRGTILNVSSVLAFQPGPWRANYAATKAYITSLTLALHEELRGSGVTATALCPGLTRTEFHARSGQDMSRVPSWLFQSAEQVARAGLAAAAAGKPLCVPGWHNRVAVAFYRHAPVSLVRRVGDVLMRRFR
ncbi:MAG: hypothetical protein KatS3mg008_1601 [Acidimicrobiales bacterium]|nr:MAG: hypothetical protein KatS3mg008_1601 [Acidimicrobiales bacterium]